MSYAELQFGFGDYTITYLINEAPLIFTIS
jgi:hypothetical protein